MQAHNVPPTKHTWELTQKNKLNKKTGRGTLKTTVMRVLGAPVFYFPFSFPIGDKRQSGVLYPDKL